MTKILIIAATEGEIRPFLSSWGQQIPRNDQGDFVTGRYRIRILITGVGLWLTAAHLTESVLQYAPDWAVQVGVAGSFDKMRPLADLVVVAEECTGDLGAEAGDQFLDVFELGLLPNVKPFLDCRLPNPFTGTLPIPPLPRVSSLSVNTVSGTDRTIQMRREKYGCAIESMEGAAFHYVCLRHGVSFLQVRSISNYVAVRDKNAWRLAEAVDALNRWLEKYVTLLPA